jgi:hypothetical protein
MAKNAKQAKATLGAENLDAAADRGYFNGEEILVCERAGITVTLPKPMSLPKNPIRHMNRARRENQGNFCGDAWPAACSLVVYLRSVQVAASASCREYPSSPSTQYRFAAVTGETSVMRR